MLPSSKVKGGMNRLHPAENVGIRGMYVYFPRMMVSSSRGASPSIACVVRHACDQDSTLTLYSMITHVMDQSLWMWRALVGSVALQLLGEGEYSTLLTH